MMAGLARGARVVLVVVAFAAALVIGLWLWSALRLAPPPVVELTTDRAAVGASTRVEAHFAEPRRGLGTVRLELVQGTRTEVLAERRERRRGALSFWGAPPAAELTLEATVGKHAQPWLEEGEVLLRAVAERGAGSLRSAEPVIVEQLLPVRLRPPRLELVSSQHYVRQGGSGAVVFRVGDTVVRSGVRSGTFESLSFPLPGGAPGNRFCLFPLPWNLGDPNQVRIFAEDDAGNRAEQPFLDLFKPMPPRTATIEVTDAFLARVVPAIASQTAGFDASGTLLEQYLRINGDLRRVELERVAAMALDSEPAFLWSGPFLQMPNTQLEATFAQTRSYRYGGREVDRQTHLGLDLASTERAPVPAPNAGKVVYAGWMSLYGNAVVIDHGYGLLTLCGHLSAVAVSAGQSVARGDVVGSSGATGLAGGDHLHVEIFLQGMSVDPVEWLDAKWIRDNLGTKLPVPGI
jgi:murein DD-endopeptidase MepM/ murein hydrolase activator NlpD